MSLKHVSSNAPEPTGAFRISGGEPPLPTFATPRSLNDRITDALHNVRLAREDGNPVIVEAAEKLLDQLLDRLPRRI
ncbi:hypothetical protein RSPPQCQH_CDS0104 [Mycolicibacterium phage phi1_186001]